MQALRLHQRWMSWPWGIIGIGIAAIMAGIGIYSLLAYPDEKPSVRLAIPMYALALYWVFALLCNQRSVVITAAGVRVVIWPFFVSLPRWIPRGTIQHCYIRFVETTDEGAVLEYYYSVGVEARNGAQTELFIFQTLEPAEELANRLALELNRAAAHPPVQVFLVKQSYKRVVDVLLFAGFWLALFLASIFAGYLWETSVG